MQEGDEVIQGCPCRQCFEVELPSPVLILRRAGRVATRTDEQRVRSRIVAGFDRRIDDVAADEARRIAEGPAAVTRGGMRAHVVG